MEELREAIRKKARERDGRIILTCADAFDIAMALDADLKDIGRICDEENIRISDCRLGCF